VTLPKSNLSRFNGAVIALRSLQQSPTPRRQIECDRGQVQRQRIKINHVKIGEIAGPNHTSIKETIQLCRVSALALYRSLKWDSTPCPIPDPVLQHERRRRRVADGAAMRPAIGQ